MTHTSQSKSKKRVPEWFTWTVEFKVHKTWVADGFDLDDDRAKEMIENDLSFAYDHETKARVLKSPDKSLILKAQGCTRGAL